MITTLILLRSKIINVKPIIIPLIDVAIFKVFFLIIKSYFGWIAHKIYVAWAFYYRLTLTKKCNVTKITIFDPKLLCCTYHVNKSTISDKNTCLAGGYI